MAVQHDDELERIFLRRRAGNAAQDHVDRGSPLPQDAAVVLFPAAIHLPAAKAGVPGRLYPLLDLSHEPGSVFEYGSTVVSYRIKSPTPGMIFEVAGWFSVTVGSAEDPFPPAGYSILNGEMPARCLPVLPSDIAVESVSSAALRRELRRLSRDGKDAWEQDFFPAVKPMLAKAVSELMNIRSTDVESSDEWGKATETVVKGGIQFSSSSRAGVSWTNWANRNIRRDIVREQDKRTGRSNADQSAVRFAVARRPAATPDQIHQEADQIYEEWKTANAYRQAVAAQPGLSFEEFTASVKGPLAESAKFPLSRFRRALEPQASTLSLDLRGNDDLGSMAERLPCSSSSLDADHLNERELVDAVASHHRQCQDSDITETVRCWLVRRGVIDAASAADAAQVDRLDIEDIEDRVFRPWQTDGLSWSRRKDRPKIRSLAMSDLAGTLQVA